MKAETIKITSREIERFKIPSSSNKVLVKTTVKNTEETTSTGIIKISKTEIDWSPGDHVSRVGIVASVPRSITYRRNEGSTLAWETDIEVYKGMQVWYDYLNSLNCVTYITENGDEYKMLDYASLYVGIVPVGKEYEKYIDNTYHNKCKSGKCWVVPLNGYVLFNQINKQRNLTTGIEVKDVSDGYKGEVMYTGRPLKAYDLEDGDTVDIQRGDVCLFQHNYEVMLENPAYATFDGGTPYKRLQRKIINLVWRGDEIIVPSGRVLVEEQHYMKSTSQGIEYIKPKLSVGRSKVLLSGVDGIDIGDEVFFDSENGMTLNVNGQTVKLLKVRDIHASVK